MVDFARLAAPFPAEAISWRVGAKSRDNTSGLALAYFDARDAQDRLDEVCGPGGWQDDYPHAGQKTVCRVGIKIGDEWVWKANGAGDTDVEQEKGALSDAFKRACTMWGIGRYLYNFPNLWVKIKPQGKSFIIDPSEEPKLLKAMRDFMAGVKIPSNSSPPERAPAPQQSSVNGRRIATQEPQLIDHNRQKGTAPQPAGGKTKAELRAEKLKAATDKRISALKSVTGWTRPTLDQFWEDNKDWIDWMSDPTNEALTEYERFSKAFADAEVNMREDAA